MGRKGSIMFTPGGIQGLGVAPGAPQATNIAPTTTTIPSTEETTTTTTNNNEEDKFDPPVPPAPASAPQWQQQQQQGLLSGDQYMSMLLKAEIEGNTRQVQDLQRRGSCVISPSGGIGGLDLEAFQDLDDDDDYDDEDDQPTHKTPQPGSADHRPLVGGFAAAAYEAAREYHYSNKNKPNTDGSNNDGGAVRNLPPPSI